MRKAGLISDTHGLLRPEALEALQGSDIILHAGDIGNVEVISSLSEIAPVTAVHGNVDKGELRSLYPHDNVVRCEECDIYMIHILEALNIDPATAGFHVVVYGHSHKPLIARKNGVLYVNPGSAGPKRFSLPVTVAIMTVSGKEVKAEIVELPV